eukprot:g14381.t1
MVPKVMETVAMRDKQITDDLAAAQAARDAADEQEEAWRRRENENRAQAQAVIAKAKADAAAKSEKKIAAAQKRLDKKLSEAEERIGEARGAALAEVEGVAAEAAQDIVARLAGASVDGATAKAAVKEAMTLPDLVTGGLDSKIQAIKDQLDEAKNLRAEAEALRNEYAARIANAEKDAAAMIEGAQREADTILVKAEADSKAMVERRKRMAEDKIAAAEREAVDEVKAVAVSAAASAAGKLIADKHGAEADKKLADEVIASI